MTRGRRCRRESAAIADPCWRAGRSGRAGALCGCGRQETRAANGLQHVRDRPDRRPVQRKVVTHLVHVAPDPTKIDLHVDDEEGRIQ